MTVFIDKTLYSYSAALVTVNLLLGPVSTTGSLARFINLSHPLTTLDPLQSRHI